MEGNGHKETDISISLKNLGTVNKNVVTVAKGQRWVNLYFSYQTLVAVDNVVSKNYWSNTTGRFLNRLEPCPENRVSHETVLEHGQRCLGRVLYSAPKTETEDIPTGEEYNVTIAIGDMALRASQAIDEVKDLNVFNTTSLLQAITGIDKKVWLDKILEMRTPRGGEQSPPSKEGD